jgi:predicted neuraminidase
MIKYAALMALFVIVAMPALAAPSYQAEMIFAPSPEAHGHVHASCIVVCPNGDLRAVWYENGPVLPSPPYYDKDRDKRSDVRIGGARKPASAQAWEAPFVMADTFGVSDNNPAMVIDAQQRLWLVYPTLLGVPDWTWGSALVQYRIAQNYDHAGPPQWTTSNILVPHAQGVRDVVNQTVARMESSGLVPADMVARYKTQLEESKKNPLIERLGWMPRAHPLVRSDGALILPLSNENFNVACMAITQDGGETWTMSNPVPESGLTQPTLVELKDGAMLAFFRNSDPARRIKRSESKDGGMTWSAATLTDLLHPGAGIEALMLRSGHIAMVYNNVDRNPRDKLAIAVSDDDGKTWKWSRHLENEPGKRFDYPSITQAPDGTIHVTYSYNLETIKHAWFNEEWVQEGD